MARAKRTLITLDVDEVCDAASLAITDSERADSLLGFLAGVRGTPGREDGSAHFQALYEIGILARLKKKQMSEKCAVAGKKGYRAILERHGIAPILSPLGSPNPSPSGSPYPAPIGEEVYSPNASPLGSPYPSPKVSPMGDTPPFFDAEMNEPTEAIPGEEVLEASPTGMADLEPSPSSGIQDEANELRRAV